MYTSVCVCGGGGRPTTRPMEVSRSNRIVQLRLTCREETSHEQTTENDFLSIQITSSTQELGAIIFSDLRLASVIGELAWVRYLIEDNMPFVGCMATKTTVANSPQHNQVRQFPPFPYELVDFLN